MSGNEGCHLYKDDSPQYPEDYRGYEHLESSLLPFFSSPTKKTAQEEGLPSVPTSTAEHTGNNTTTAAVKAESEIKREMGESSIPMEVKVEASVKDEMKEGIKEESLPQTLLLQFSELSEEEHDEEVERNGPKILRARQKIESIYQRANPRASQNQLFKKFKHLIYSGNCQGPVIDAVWDEWQDIFPANWTPYRHKVHQLKAKMNEDRHLRERKATW